MTGKEAIIEKILSDARSIANSTVEEAGLYGKKIIADAELDAQAYREKNVAESYVEREEIIRRKITSANLEVKKNILAKKQELMSSAFSEAIRLIKSDKNYSEMIKSMLTYAESGDAIRFSSYDKEIFDEKWLEAYSSETGKKLVFGGYGDFSGGVIISGVGSDKNLSLEVELKSVREKYEPELADILFGE